MTISESIVIAARNQTKSTFAEIEKDSRKAVGSVAKETQSAAKSTDILGSSLGKLVTGGALLALAGQAVQFGQKAVKAYEESAQAQAQMEAVLRSTGGAAGMTTGELNALAAETSKLTGIDDDLLVKNEAILLTFRDISEDVFPATLQAAADLSAAMGQDLQSSIVQLGKALNSPTEGLTALRRVGVSFTDEQEAMIKGLAESGDLLGAQKAILVELNKEFGGAAKAIHDAGSGSDTLVISVGNLTEQFGRGLMPAVQAVNKELSEYIDLSTISFTVQNDLRDAREKGVISEKEYRQWIIQAKTGTFDAAEAQAWLTQKIKEWNLQMSYGVDQVRAQAGALPGAAAGLSTYAEAADEAGFRVAKMAADQERAAKGLTDMKSNWETLLSVLDREVESPIASFIKDLEWLQAGGGQINLAFEQIKTGVLEGTITPDEAKPMLQGLYIATLDVKEEIGQVDIWEAAKQGAADMGLKAGEVKSMIEGTEGVTGALARVGEIETVLGLDATALTDAIGYADTMKTRQAEIDARKIKPDVDTSGLQGGINKANELDTALGRIDKQIDIYINYHVTGNPPGGQHGLHMTVPPGFPNDSFPVMASSGETVDISPGAAPSAGAGGGLAGSGGGGGDTYVYAPITIVPPPGTSAGATASKTAAALTRARFGPRASRHAG